MDKLEHGQVRFENPMFAYGFTQAANVVLTATELSPYAKVVYFCLIRYANMPHGAMPSWDTLAEESNMSRRSVANSMKSLYDFELIGRIRRPNSSNLYLIKEINPQVIHRIKPVVTRKCKMCTTQDLGNAKYALPEVQNVHSINKESINKETVNNKDTRAREPQDREFHFYDWVNKKSPLNGDE